MLHFVSWETVGSGIESSPEEKCLEELDSG